MDGGVVHVNMTIPPPHATIRGNASLSAQAAQRSMGAAALAGGASLSAKATPFGVVSIIAA